jgi:transcriptional regulator with XRE-family HTH domain
MNAAPNRIKELRDQRGWSLRDLAERCGLTFTMIQRLENGTTQLDVEKMRRISRGFNLPASALLNDEDVEFRANETGNEIMRILREIPPSDCLATLTAAREMVRIANTLAARRSAGALHGQDRQVGELAEMWNGFDDERRDRALDLLKVSGIRG